MDCHLPCAVIGLGGRPVFILLGERRSTKKWGNPENCTKGIFMFPNALLYLF